MNIIYHCFGGAHSSVLAAAIHLGYLPRERKPTGAELERCPYFDRQKTRDHGWLWPMGEDDEGNRVFVLGRRNLAPILNRAITGVANIYDIDPRSYLLVDTLPLVNQWMKVGGLMSRGLGISDFGRPFVHRGVTMAHPQMAELVKETIERIKKVKSGRASGGSFEIASKLAGKKGSKKQHGETHASPPVEGVPEPGARKRRALEGTPGQVAMADGTMEVSQPLNVEMERTIPPGLIPTAEGREGGVEGAGEGADPGQRKEREGSPKVFYHCYGSAHSSIVSSAIHVGLLPLDEVPSNRRILGLDYFDRVKQSQIGTPIFIGVDEEGSEVYAIGVGWGKDVLEKGLRSFLNLYDVAEDEFILADTLTHAGWMTRLGGFLSRRLGLVRLGRPLAARGICRNYQRFTELVRVIKQGPSGAQGNPSPGATS